MTQNNESTILNDAPHGNTSSVSGPTLADLCVRNGVLIPASEAVLPVSNTELEYGFGVYETLRVENGVVYFTQQHIDRLLHSSRVITLEHTFSPSAIAESIQLLVNAGLPVAQTFNIKVLLIGGKTPEDATLTVFASAPLFVERSLYKTGCEVITVPCERAFPGAKTLNMLPSYLAYRKAKAAGVYDALLVNRDGNITEGTRTNFFVVKDRTIITPPAADILEGVTKMALLAQATAAGFSVQEQPIAATSLFEYDGAFLTSTSTKVLPIRTINGTSYETIAPAILELSHIYRDFWNASGGVF